MDLLIEAKPLDYTGLLSNTRAKANDVFAFDTGSQQFIVKVSTLKKGKMLYYRKNKDALMFYMALTDDSGKVQKKIPMISKAGQVIATIATIACTELTDATMRPAAVFRIPATGVKADTVANIISRYVKKLAPRYEVIGTLEGMGGFNYVLITLKGTTSSVFDIFGLDANFTLREFVAKEPSPEVANAKEKVAAQVDAQVKKNLPTKINLNMVPGYEMPDAVAAVNKLTKSVYDNPDAKPPKPISMDNVFDVRNRLLLKSIQPMRLGAYYQTETKNAAQSAASIEIYKELTEYLRVNDGITISDFAHDTEKGIFVKEKMMSMLKADLGFLGDGTLQKLFKSIIGNTMRDACNEFDDDVIWRYTKHKPKWSSPETQEAVYNYTGSGYKPLNNFLIHGVSTLSDEGIASRVEGMDRAFANDSVTLPDNTPVFRSMSMPDWLLLEAANNKAFHFRTFVSTSLLPRIGWGFNGKSYEGVGGARYVDEIDDTWNIPDQVSTCMTIMLNDEIPVIVPGGSSFVEKECEVILSRGTTVKIKKVGLDMNTIAGGGVTVHSAYIDSVALSTEQLTLETVIYDGDEFFSTGRLVEFANFTGKPKKKKQEIPGGIGRYQIETYRAIADAGEYKKLSKQEREMIDRSVDKFTKNCG